MRVYQKLTPLIQEEQLSGNEHAKYGKRAFSNLPEHSTGTPIVKGSKHVQYGKRASGRLPGHSHKHSYCSMEMQINQYGG